MTATKRIFNFTDQIYAAQIADPENIPGIGGGVPGDSFFPDRVNVKAFGASGSKTQTEGNVSAGSRTVEVENPGSFQIGQDFFMDDAGTMGRGTDWITTIVGKDGNNLLTDPLQPAAARPKAGAMVQHDDTRAILQAIYYLFTTYGGGDVCLPSGFYRCSKEISRALTDARPALPGYPEPDAGRPVNAILHPPFFNHTSPLRVLRFIGSYDTKGLPGVKSEYGTILYTDLTGTTHDNNNVLPSFFGCRSLVGPADYQTGFSRLKLIFENINLRMPDNSYLCGIQAANILNCIINNVTIDTHSDIGSITTAPNNPSSGIIMPLYNNFARCRISNTSVEGINRAYVLSEHMNIDEIYVWRCLLGLDFTGGGHEINGRRISLEHVAQAIRFQGESNVTLGISIEEAEEGHWYSRGSRPHVTTYSIPYDNLDPNRAHGTIDYSYSVQYGTPFDGGVRKIITDHTSANYLKLHNRNYPNQVQVHGNG